MLSTVGGLSMTTLSDAWEPLTARPPRGGRAGSNNSTSRAPGDPVSPVPGREDFGTEASYRSMSESADRYCKDTGVCANEGAVRSPAAAGPRRRRREGFDAGDGGARPPGKERVAYEEVLREESERDDERRMKAIRDQVRPLDEPVPPKYDSSGIQGFDAAAADGFDDFSFDDAAGGAGDTANGGDMTILPRSETAAYESGVRDLAARRGARGAGDAGDAGDGGDGGDGRATGAAAAPLRGLLAAARPWHEALLLVLVSALFLLVAKMVMDAGYFLAVRRLL